jgi:hypothetical protein
MVKRIGQRTMIYKALRIRLKIVGVNWGSRIRGKRMFFKSILVNIIIISIFM